MEGMMVREMANEVGNTILYTIYNKVGTLLYEEIWLAGLPRPLNLHKWPFYGYDN